MNFTLFSVHSISVTLAVAILVTTLAKSAAAATPTETQPSQSLTGSNSESIIDNLKPNPNPLQFPTKPEEVKIQKNVSITLVQALELARRNNNNLQIAIFQRERSQSAVRQAQAALLPTVNLSGTLTNSGPVFTNNIDSTSPSSSFSGQAQANYNLYTSGNTTATIRAAEEQLRIDELNVETQSLTIALNVATQYYNLQSADEQIRINESAVRNAQASLKDAQAQLQAGIGTEFSLLQAQVTLANAQQKLITAISQQHIASRQLGILLVLPQSVDISAADPVKLAGLWPQTLEETIVQAFQKRPELPQELAQRNIYEQQRREALSQLGPQLSLTGTYSLSDQFHDNVSAADGYSVGLTASIRLFDGGAAKANAAQSKANIAIAEHQFASQRDQIRFNVEQYYFQLQSNLDNVQTATTALGQAQEALRIARLRFQAGVGTQTDVISAENDLTTAEGNRVSAILAYNLALANLQSSVNGTTLTQLAR